MNGQIVLKKRLGGGNMKLFIFGSTGDLVRRKILPALHPFENLHIYVLGRKTLDNEQYNKEQCKICSDEFKSRLNYIQISFEESIYNKIEEFLDKKEINYFYVSMPPNFIIDVLKKVVEVKDKGFKVQILIEKPFGSNLKEAKEINSLIDKNKIRNEVYLSDHYLFKENILFLEKTPFTKMKIVVLEEVGLEGRGYYDSVGALKDMVQSHLLNTLYKINEFGVKDFKVIEFKRGQYKNYQKEIGKKSDTETHVMLRFKIGKNEFEVETGKKHPKRESFIEIDGLKKEIPSHKEDYVKLFSDFFSGKKKNFPTIESAITNWEIIEEIEKNKPEIFFY